MGLLIHVDICVNSERCLKCELSKRGYVICKTFNYIDRNERALRKSLTCIYIGVCARRTNVSSTRDFRFFLLPLIDT